MPFKKEPNILFFLILLAGAALAIISFAFNSSSFQASAISPALSRASDSGSIACVCPFGYNNGGSPDDSSIQSDCSGKVGACGSCRVWVFDRPDSGDSHLESRPCGEVTYPEPPCHCPPVPSGATVTQPCPVSSPACYSYSCVIESQTYFPFSGPWGLLGQLPSGAWSYSAQCRSV